MSNRRKNAVAFAVAVVAVGVSAPSYAARSWIGGGNTNSLIDTSNWASGLLPNFAAGSSTASTGANNGNNDAVFNAASATTVTVPSTAITDTIFRNITFAGGSSAFTFNDDGSGLSEFGNGISANITPTMNNLSSNPITFNTHSFVWQRGQILATGGDFVFNVPLGIGVAPASAPTLQNTKSIVLGGDHDFYLNRGLAGNFNNQTIKTGAGTLYLGPSGGGYTGQLRIDSGNVVVDSSSAFGDAGTENASWTEIRLSSAAVLMSNNITTGETFYLSARTDNSPHIISTSGNNTITGLLLPETDPVNNIYALESRGTAAGDFLTVASSSELRQFGAFAPGTGNLSLQGAGNGAFNGILEDNPTNDANNSILNVIKNGTGKWTLSSPNGHSGTTIVAQGILAIGDPASLANTSSIAVNSGATLDLTLIGGYSLSGSQILKGSGAVLGQITAGGSSTIAPGDTGTVGTLTLGALSLTGNTLKYDLAATAADPSDRIVVTGDLSLSNVTTLGINKIGNDTAPGTYRIIDYNGSLTGGASNLMVASVAGAPFGTTRQTFLFDTSVAHQVNLTIGGSAAASLTWVGGASSNTWDVKDVVNFTGDTAATPDNRFYNADSVTFTDSGLNSPVIISGTVIPSQATFTNSAGHSYTFTGGEFADGGSLTVSGTGDVTFNNGALSVRNDVVASGGGLLAFTNNGATTFSGSVNVSGARNLTIANSGNQLVSIAGNLSVGGSAAVNIGGNGNVTIGGNTVLATTGTTTFSNNGGLTFTGPITLNNGTLSFNRSSNTTATALTGSGTLRQDGSGTTTLSGDNSNFLGSVIVAGGTLQTATTAVNPLGAKLMSTTVLNGGTLDVNGNPNLTAQVITIAGNGASGQQGALVDNSGLGTGAAVRAIIGGVVLSADATIYGAANTFPSAVDGGPLQGNGHSLTLAGGAEWVFSNAGETHLANITFQNGGGGHGAFWVGSTTFGDQPGVITLQSDGRLGIEGLSAPITKPIVVADTGAIVEFGTGGPNDSIASQVTINNRLDAFVIAVTPTTSLILDGKLTGAGGLAVHQRTIGSGRGTVAVTSDSNDFAGPITIGGGFGATGDLYIATAANDRSTLSIGNGGTTGKIGPGDVSIAAPAFLRFNKNATYTFANKISGAGTVTSIATSSAVTLTGNLSYTGQTVVTGGLLRVASANASIGGVAVGIGATFEAASTQSATAVAIDDGGRAQIATGGANKKVLTVGSTSTAGTVSIAGAGVLDVNDDALVVAYPAAGTSPLATIQGYLAAGFNAGSWDGAGINSTAAHSHVSSLTALGYAENSDLNLATLDGAGVPSSAVLVKYTYYGDSNLDGSVTTADFQRYLDGLTGNGSTWAQGDYTYDGKVDLGNDFNLFLRAYLQNGGALGDLAPLVLADGQLTSAQRASLLAVVPEPSSVGLIAIAGAGLAARRRKRSSQGVKMQCSR
jgi:fibronectin-binding autotransporter adhesin